VSPIGKLDHVDMVLTVSARGRSPTAVKLAPRRDPLPLPGTWRCWRPGEIVR